MLQLFCFPTVGLRPEELTALPGPSYLDWLAAGTELWYWGRVDLLTVTGDGCSICP